jgi:hypothetical protein
MSLFLSVTGLILAVYACICGSKNIRRFSLIMTVLLLVLALGSHTPLFRFLYYYVPGFNMFRGSSKFTFPASMFIALLAGIGMDLVLRNRVIPKAVIIVVLLVGTGFLTAALYLQSPAAMNSADGFWRHILQMVYSTGQFFTPRESYKNPVFIRQAGMFAAGSMLITGGVCLLVGSLFILYRFFRWVCYIILFLAIIEIFFFAKSTLVYYSLAATQSSALKEFVVNYSGDYRILLLESPDDTMMVGLQNIWGYEQGILKRYSEFMSFTQGMNPDQRPEEFVFRHFNSLYKMLRCRYYLPQNKDKDMTVVVTGPTLPRLLLVQDWMLIPNRDDIFKAMESPAFDVNKTVILENTPDPMPEKTDPQGTVRVVNSSTDYLTIEADLSSSAILLVTDIYSKGWRVRALPESTQREYKVMPANYILRAIPLSKGHHLFRLEYMPLGFRIGKWISLISVIIYAGLLIRHFKNSKIRTESARQ